MGDSILNIDKFIESLKGTEQYDRYKEILDNLINSRQYQYAYGDEELLNYKDENGLTPLMHSVITHSDSKVISQLLLNGSNPCIKDDKGRTALVYAIRMQNIQAFDELLVCNKTDLNTTTFYKSTPLMLAAMKDDTYFCKRLLDAGVDFTAQNYRGDTALETALLCGSHRAANLLVKGNLFNVGYTPVMTAIYNQEYSSAKLQIDQFRYGDKHLDAVNNGGYTALMLTASIYRNITDEIAQLSIFEIALQLIRKGADVGIKNKTLDNFFNLAEKSNMLNSSERLQQVVSACSSEEYSKLHNGMSFFHFAIKCGLGFGMLSSVLSDKVINLLDSSGNSPFSYVLFDTEKIYSKDDVLKMINNYGAKFIRNGLEFKSQLQIKILCMEDDGSANDFIAEGDLATLNTQDENRRTALHYACMLGKKNIAKELVLKGACLDICDDVGRTPMHYAAINSYMLPGASINDLERLDNFGVTPIILWCQHGTDIEAMDKFCELEFADNSINRYLKIFDGTQRSFEQLANDNSLKFTQKLAILSAFKNYARVANFDGVNEALGFLEVSAQKIIEREISNSTTIELAKNFAIGLELEVPELPRASFIPTTDLLSWFHADLVYDATVKKSALSLYTPMDNAKQESLEFVSKVIVNNSQYEKFVILCDSLYKSGAKVNRSAGMHVHVNCRGTDKVNPPVLKLVNAADELVFLKYVVINYISIEQLLRGFMRDGILFDEYGPSYVETLSKYRERILACNTVTELQKICTHNKTLDLTSLDKHGTIEFRIHEGLIDPLLLKAWVDCVTRLVNISYEQFIEHKAYKSIKPKHNIEQLVYLLITMRHYNQTWCSAWAAPKSANIDTASLYPGHNSIAAQRQIQQSPLYNMAAIIFNSSSENLAYNLKQYLNLQQFGVQDLLLVLSELKELICFAIDNPGPFSPRLDKAHVLEHIQNILPVRNSTLVFSRPASEDQYISLSPVRDHVAKCLRASEASWL
jgi:ankyrin repeat protein